MKWTGFDLDGTLAERTQYPFPIGAPRPSVIEKLMSLMQAGKSVKIFTARAGDESQIPLIREWLGQNGLPSDMEITCQKDYDLEEFYDDRAVRVDHRTGAIQVIEETPEGDIKKTTYTPTEVEVASQFGNAPESVYAMADTEAQAKKKKQAKDNFSEMSAIENGKDPSLLEKGVLYQYDAKDDNRTRPEHRKLDGAVVEGGTVAAASITPPSDKNCRCRLVKIKRQPRRPILRKKVDNYYHQGEGDAAMRQFSDESPSGDFVFAIEKQIMDFSPSLASKYKDVISSLKTAKSGIDRLLDIAKPVGEAARGKTESKHLSPSIFRVIENSRKKLDNDLAMLNKLVQNIEKRESSQDVSLIRAQNQKKFDEFMGGWKDDLTGATSIINESYDKMIAYIDAPLVMEAKEKAEAEAKQKLKAEGRESIMRSKRFYELQKDFVSLLQSAKLYGSPEIDGILKSLEKYVPTFNTPYEQIQDKAAVEKESLEVDPLLKELAVRIDARKKTKGSTLEQQEYQAMPENERLDYVLSNLRNPKAKIIIGASPSAELSKILSAKGIPPYIVRKIEAVAAKGADRSSIDELIEKYKTIEPSKLDSAAGIPLEAKLEKSSQILAGELEKPSSDEDRSARIEAEKQKISKGAMRIADEVLREQYVTKELENIDRRMQIANAIAERKIALKLAIDNNNAQEARSISKDIAKARAQLSLAKREMPSAQEWESQTQSDNQKKDKIKAAKALPVPMPEDALAQYAKLYSLEQIYFANGQIDGFYGTVGDTPKTREWAGKNIVSFLNGMTAEQAVERMQSGQRKPLVQQTPTVVASNDAHIILKRLYRFYDMDNDICKPSREYMEDRARRLALMDIGRIGAGVVYDDIKSGWRNLMEDEEEKKNYDAICVMFGNCPNEVKKFADKGGMCAPGSCVRKVGNNWRVVSNKTGKLWPAKYNTEQDAKDALAAYHIKR